MKKTKMMSFSLIFAGLCFFFNPYFAAVDILPDFMGALLVAAGIFPYTRLYAPMREASRAFLILALADFVKTAMLVFVFGSSTMGEQEILILIVAFLSATVGTVFAVQAFRALFDGLYTMAARENCAALYANGEKGEPSPTERTARFAMTFLVLREAISLLPEFAALLNSTYVDSDFIRLYDYIGTMRLLVLIPVLVLGIIYLVKISRYFRLAMKCHDLREALALRYASFMDAHPGIRIKARHALAFSLVGIGALFLTDFYLDTHNIIPDTLAACLMLAGVCLLRLPRKALLPVASAIAGYGIVATLSTRLSYRFSIAHVGADITRSEAVAKEYLVMWLVSLLEMLVFFAMLALVLLALRKTLITWGGYKPERMDDFETRNAKLVRDEFDWQFIKCYLLGFLSALASFLFDYLQSWPDTRAFRILEGFWILDFALALFFAVYLCYILSLAMGKVRERFQFE